MLEAHFTYITLQPFFIDVFKTSPCQEFGLADFFVGKPCKSSSSRSARSFLHDRTSITGFPEDHAYDMLYTAFNTISFSP
jgi:hypothetical protein